MSDYISRKAAIDHVKAQRERFFTGCTIEEGMEMLIREVPSADVVEVVRCKDCKYGMSYESIFVFCHLLKIKVNEEGFCYLGGRRTDG